MSNVAVTSSPASAYMIPLFILTISSATYKPIMLSSEYSTFLSPASFTFFIKRGVTFVPESIATSPVSAFIKSVFSLMPLNCSSLNSQTHPDLFFSIKYDS